MSENLSSDAQNLLDGMRNGYRVFKDVCVFDEYETDVAYRTEPDKLVPDGYVGKHYTTRLESAIWELEEANLIEFRLIKSHSPYYYEQAFIIEDETE